MTVQVPKAAGSIRRRLTLQLVGSAALLAAVLFFLVQGFARQVAEQSQDTILLASATAIADASRVSQGEVRVDLPYSALSMLGTVSDDRVFYRVASGTSTVTGYDDLPLPTATPDAEGQRAETRMYRGEEVRLVSVLRRLSHPNGPLDLTVVVAQTRDGQTARLARISQVAAGLGAGFFVLAALLALFATRSTLRPLGVLTESVARRGPQDLRPLRAPAPAEMLPLVEALNGLMARLSSSLTRSEDFIAEAAHRVRTPLATLRTQAEVALRRVKRPENRKALKDMIRTVDESARSAGQMLDHAMVTFRSDQLETASVGMSALAEDVARRLRPMAELREIEIVLDLTSSEAHVQGDAILLQSALRNIVDNAVKYAPEDSCVTLSVRVAEDEVATAVRDLGPGFPAEAAERLTERFVRGDNSGGVVGSGLGLTIAEEVARAHNGRLELANNEGGGGCVTLWLPLDV